MGSIKMLTPASLVPAMPPVSLHVPVKPEAKRADLEQIKMADPSSDIDTFKDREFVIGETFEEWLNSSVNDDALKKVLISLTEVAFKEISDKIKEAATNKQGTVNEFGDEQLAIDVLADKLMFKALSSTFCVGAATSEETAEICNLPTYPDELGNNKTGGYCCAFDPLDGSSIIDTNFAVGTIFGIWPGNKLTGIKGKDQAAAGMCVYGPRTQLTISVPGYCPGTHEFLLTPSGRWIRTLDMNSVNEGIMYSPGNLRAREDNEGYKELTNYWLDNGYRLRYSGGMVPDVNQILIKGFGVFTYPASKKHPAKLRCLYEVAPLGLLIENAGGFTSEGEKSVLETVISDVNQTSQCAFGSKDEVKRFEELVGKKAFEPGEYDKKYVEMK